MNTANVVQKLWNYCNVLRDDSIHELLDVMRLRRSPVTGDLSLVTGDSLASLQTSHPSLATK